MGQVESNSLVAATTEIALFFFHLGLCILPNIISFCAFNFGFRLFLRASKSLGVLKVEHLVLKMRAQFFFPQNVEIMKRKRFSRTFQDELPCLISFSYNDVLYICIIFFLNYF